MSWGNNDKSKQELKLKAGSPCPNCQQSLCLNGAVAADYQKPIVTCQNCHQVFCAICGEIAQKDQNQKYFCSQCSPKKLEEKTPKKELAYGEIFSEEQ